MKRVKFYEYSGFLMENGETDVQCNRLPLLPQELHYLRAVSESLVPGKEIFDIGSSEIRAKSLVGVLAFGGVQIEILPKLIRYESRSQELGQASILRNLMFMLSYTNSLDISDTGIGTLSSQNDSFIEAYIGIYASRLLRHLIRSGVPKRYVSKSENLNVIRGRIVFGRDSVLNISDRSKVFCEYSEFTENNTLSKAFKYVAQALGKLSTNSENCATIHRCVGMLDGVEASYVYPDEFSRMSNGHRDQNLLALSSLTKMFLKKLRPELAGSSPEKVFALLFDMNELFEEFIFQVLRRHSKELDIEVTAQKKKRLVSDERDLMGDGTWKPRQLFDTFTDISIKPRIGRTFIIDTKYKVVGHDRSHYGIGNQDAYQVLAYRQIHKQKDHDPSIALLYPKSEAELRKQFRVNGSSTTFTAWTIDISRDLRTSMCSLVEDLRTLIQHGITDTDGGAA